jgi:uncharacterized membrane protein
LESVSTSTIGAVSCGSSGRVSRLRIFTLVLGVICLNALGNLSLAWGMKHVGESVNLNPLSFLRVMLDPAVATGILLLILWLLSRMTLLSWADLSFVLPLTSLGYVLAAVFGKVFLNETVTGAHWVGTGLIFVGTTIVGTTDSRTSDRTNPEQQ